MTKVTIEKIFKDEKETQHGKRLQVSIKVKEQNVQDINDVSVNVAGKYIRGFFPADFPVPFKEGDEVELLIATKGEYLNFSIPGVGKPPKPGGDSLLPLIKSLEDRISKVEDAVFGAQDPDAF